MKLRWLDMSSIRQRLTLSLVVVAFSLGGMIGVTVWYVVQHELTELMDQGLRESAELIHNVLSHAPQALNQTSVRSSEADYEEHLVWQLVDVHTRQVIRRSAKAPIQALTSQVSDVVVHSDDGLWHLLSFSFQHTDDRILVVAQSAIEREEALGETVLYASLMALAVGLLATLLMNARIRAELRPLQQLSRSVQSFDPMAQGALLAGVHRAELEPIETAIEELGQRLSRRITTERAFTAHAAHALRTPVAGIDAQLAMAIKEAPLPLQPRLQRTRLAAARLGRVVQALLGMFRSGLEPQYSQVRIAELLQVVAFNDLRIEVAPDLEVQADADLLAPALLNVLDNAQRHGADTVQIELTTTAEGYALRIQDNGQGCPEPQLQTMRQALERQDYSTSSGLRGLGLILADLVMRAHGGQLQLPASACGFVLVMRWPQPKLGACGLATGKPAATQAS